MKWKRQYINMTFVSVMGQKVGLHAFWLTRMPAAVAAGINSVQPEAKRADGLRKWNSAKQTLHFQWPWVCMRI